MENSIHAPTPRIFEKYYITVWNFPGTIKVASRSTSQAGGQSNRRKGEQQSISLFIRLRDTGESGAVATAGAVGRRTPMARFLHRLCRNQMFVAHQRAVSQSQVAQRFLRCSACPAVHLGKEAYFTHEGRGHTVPPPVGQPRALATMPSDLLNRLVRAREPHGSQSPWIYRAVAPLPIRIFKQLRVAAGVGLVWCAGCCVQP
jgi:hypothetical protein